MKSIKQIKLKDKIILLRDDFNVTLNPEGKIIDDIKIRVAMKTIKYLLKQKVKKIVIVTHLGRPIIRAKTKIKDIISGNRGLILKPIAKDLAKNLKIRPINFSSEIVNNFILPFYKLNKKIWLMENIRFCAGEEVNDNELAKQLAKLADIYIDDAFGNAHRKHTSMVGITNYLPSYAGLLFEKEIKNLTKILKKPQKPFVLIIGGAKVSEKILILKKLVRKASKILLGGVMANTFLAGRQIDMRNSNYDKDSIDIANDIYSTAAGKFYLPTDLEWRRGMAVDIGKTTIDQYEKIINTAKTIFWNGTMGLTSMGNYKYSFGTRAIIQAIACSNAQDKIVCGGDTIAEVDKMKMTNKMTHISTGGGAALMFLTGKKLPAIEALNRK